MSLDSVFNNLMVKFPLFLKCSLESFLFVIVSALLCFAVRHLSVLSDYIIALLRPVQKMLLSTSRERKA